LSQRYTRKEAGRISGVNAARLRYWERLQLVRPKARWGERFYSFGDLVALGTLKRLTGNRIPARRVRRAIELVEQQFGQAPLPLEALRLLEQGRDVLVVPPGIPHPFNPFKQQWALPFESSLTPTKPHTLTAPTPEELFESALDCEAEPEYLPEAVRNYRRALEMAPDWIEAHINLGVALYQMGKAEEARAEFLSAVQVDPLNGIAQYNLGCVLEEQGEIEEAIVHLTRAARAMPAHPDVHFNLALAYEKRGDIKPACEQWSLYLRHAPNGPWATQARMHLKNASGRRKRSAPIPFPSKASGKR
jgi:tetratricopeptide (TPR) repeat protein